MRILVLLKGNYFYVCSSRKSDTRDDYRRFLLANGADVEMPQANIIAVETYTTSTTDRYRIRYKKLQDSKEWTELTNES